jgi:hypothetical protein
VRHAWVSLKHQEVAVTLMPPLSGRGIEPRMTFNFTIKLRFQLDTCFSNSQVFWSSCLSGGAINQIEHRLANLSRIAYSYK